MPKLDAAELAEVRQHLALLRTLAGEGPVDVDEQLVIDAISIVLRENGMGASIEQFTGSSAHVSFKEKLPDLHAFLALASKQRNEQRAILYVGVSLLYDHLIKFGIPVGTRVLMTHIHRVPEFINAAFPGYTRAGLLPWIMHRMAHRRNTDGTDNGPG